MVSEHVAKLCQAAETVSSVLAKDPRRRLGCHKKLYGHHKKDLHYDPEKHRSVPSADDLATALKSIAGQRNQPSLSTSVCRCAQLLDADPCWIGLSSFNGFAWNSTLLLFTLADIVRHCSNLIVRAEKKSSSSRALVAFRAQS